MNKYFNMLKFQYSKYFSINTLKNGKQNNYCLYV